VTSIGKLVNTPRSRVIGQSSRQPAFERWLATSSRSGRTRRVLRRKSLQPGADPGAVVFFDAWQAAHRERPTFSSSIRLGGCTIKVQFDGGASAKIYRVSWLQDPAAPTQHTSSHRRHHWPERALTQAIEFKKAANVSGYLDSDEDRRNGQGRLRLLSFGSSKRRSSTSAAASRSTTLSRLTPDRLSRHFTDKAPR